ncbi:hypothetical protein AHF37_04739 [Paragonimus kellicotti]|nr:hypothetical protein AHF37_04739 [Paragonimus kellicotti]
MCDVPRSILPCPMSVMDCSTDCKQHRRSLNFTQSSSLHMDEDMDVVVTGAAHGPVSAGSSGFGGSTGLMDGTGPNPSPILSDSSSPNSEYHCLPVKASHMVGCPIGKHDQTAFCGNDELQPPLVQQMLAIAQCTTRHQSLPTESLPGSVCPSGRRRQSSPGCQRSAGSPPLPPPPPSCPSSRNGVSLTTSFNKLNLRGRCRGGSCDVYVRPVPAAVNSLSPSSLEPIPQGQELSVITTNLPMATSPNTVHSPGGIPIRQTCKRGMDTPQLNKTTHTPPTGSMDHGQQFLPCCPCRVECHAEPLDSKSGYNSRMHKPIQSSVVEENFDSPRSVPSKSDNRGQSLLGGTHWARDLIGRLRSNSVNTSTDHVESRVNSTATRRYSTPRSTDLNRVTETFDNEPGVPDAIDPRRLPKTQGPSSTCLQFSMKPLQPLIGTSSPAPTSKPIPMTPTHCGSSSGSSALKSTSWKPRKQSARVRWLSHSSSHEPTADTAESCFDSSPQARLSCSAVEEFQGAVDLLATGRFQTFSPAGLSAGVQLGSLNRTPGIRVKRASESERLLVISKSLSEDKEEPSSYTFGHFDENNAYSTLFRHSTCYDVLPDSGKLVVLDSRIGVVRAIRALLENGVQAAPIWQSATQRITGLFSQDLALHLLLSLYLSNSPEDCIPAATTDQALPSVTVDLQLCNLNEGLRVWGTRQLGDILRLFSVDPSTNRSFSFHSALVVSPQTRLKKALVRLLRASKSPACVLPQYSISLDAHHSMDSSDMLDCCFAMDTSVSKNDKTAFQSTRLPSTRPIRQSCLHRQCSAPEDSSSSSHNADDYQLRLAATAAIAAQFPPTHLIVMNPSCGNVLGLLGADRLLAYLRLRLDELPYSPQLMSPIGSISGLRWTERYCLLRQACTSHNYRQLDIHGTVSAATHHPLPESPVLTPSTLCHVALRVLSAWLPVLPALPVVCINEGAATQTNNTLVGLITPGDLLNWVLNGSPDAATTQPVSKILETKLLYCPFQQDYFCHTEETVAHVLDRMFHLRAPCLVLFDASRSGAPIGMITSRDLLYTIVASKSNRLSTLPNTCSNNLIRSDHERMGVASGPPSGSPMCELEYDGEDIVDIDEAVPEASFKQPRLKYHAGCSRKLKHVTIPDSGLYASGSSTDSMSSGDTYSAHSESDRVTLHSRVERRRKTFEGRSAPCPCACHLGVRENARPGGDASVVRGTAGAIHAKPIRLDSATSGRDAVQTAPVYKLVHHIGMSDGSTLSGALSSRRRIISPIATGTTKSATSERSSTTVHSKRGDEDEVLFPMD